MSKQIELRFLDMPVEALTGEGGVPIIKGVSPVFNAISEILIDPEIGVFREVIEPGALDDIWDNMDTRGRFDHKILLGRTKNNTMFLRKTDAGVEYEIWINPNDPEAMAAYEKVRRKDVDGASFMFVVSVGGEKWEVQDGIPLRRVRKIDELMDVGPVTFPAYPQASASTRSKVIELRQQFLQQTPSPEGESVENSESDQKVDDLNNSQTLELMAMELEIDEIKE